MDGVVEAITGRERRRRWSIEDKPRIVAEAEEPGARVRDVAARHGVCESPVFTWRRQAREGVLVAPEMPVFVPVRVLDAPVLPTAGPSRPEPRPAPFPDGLRPERPPAFSPSGGPPSAMAEVGLIEIESGDGRRVRVGSDVNLGALRRALAASRG